jgi:serine phosphatase RsbU (regulator of sigma subunit)/tetratricopeptide (TPR) repeat protein
MRILDIFIWCSAILLFADHVDGQDFNEIDSLNRLYASANADSDRVVLLTKISVHYWYNNPDTAIAIAQKGLKMAEKIDFSKGIANSLHVMGYAYSIQGNYPAALECNLKALKIREEINDKKGMERSYNNIGNIYLDRNDYSKADEYYRKGLKLAEELNIEKDIALLSNNIGRMHYFKKEFQKSIEFYSRALKISEKNQFKFELAISYLNLGRSYVELGNYNSAENILNKGLAMSEKMKNKEKTSMALTSLAEICFKTGRYSKSIEFGKKSLEAATEIKGLQYMKEAARILYESYLQTNDYPNALHYHEVIMNVNDSLFSDDKSKEINNLQHQFELEQQKKEIELLEKDNKIAQQDIKAQKIITVFFGCGFLMLLMLAIIIFKSRQKQLKANVLLKKQRNLITEKNEELQQLNEEISTQRDNLQEINIELQSMNDEIMAQNEKIINQNEIIEEKNKKITASIIYAGRIQKAMLPADEALGTIASEYFIFYKPRDIVSGDFFWNCKIGNYLYLAVADCTGHGVPGAFMSMLGISLLNEIINKDELQSPAIILDELRRRIKKSLNQTGKKGEPQDGMDIALLLINIENLKLQFAGAYNPLYIIRPVIHENQEESNPYEFIEIKSDRMPIGIYPKELRDFTNHNLDLQCNDSLYIFSDGYVSQFGGERSDKMKTKRFQEVLLKIQDKPMEEQKQLLEQNLTYWQGNREQIDDILVIGLKVKDVLVN